MNAFWHAAREEACEPVVLQKLQARLQARTSAWLHTGKHLNGRDLHSAVSAWEVGTHAGARTQLLGGAVCPPLCGRFASDDCPPCPCHCPRVHLSLFLPKYFLIKKFAS